MTDKERLIRARLAVLTLAAEVHNVARACKLAGVSRSQFYAMKKAYGIYGEEGLIPRARRKPQMPNRTPAQEEEQILLQTRKYPLISYIRLAAEMKSGGGSITPTMVRYVWRRHGLSTRSARLEWARSVNGEAACQKPNNPYELHLAHESLFDISETESVLKVSKDSTSEKDGSGKAP